MVKTLGQHVRDRREALRMTQADLARRMGRDDRSYLSRIEHDETKAPNVVLLQAVADALEEDLDDLLRETGLTLPADNGDDITEAQERLIAFTRAHLSHLSASEVDRLIRMIEAGFGEGAPG
jgi:transcriptional regulator with XRE-family HTH domain